MVGQFRFQFYWGVGEYKFKNVELSGNDESSATLKEILQELLNQYGDAHYNIGDYGLGTPEHKIFMDNARLLQMVIEEIK